MIEGLGLLDAFDHMISTWVGRVPKDLHEAKQSRIGKRRYALSESRAKKMLLRYGNGKYEVEEVVTYLGAAAST